MIRHRLKAFVLATFTTVAAAQGYPDKPVTLVQGFAAGGHADTIARIVGFDVHGYQLDDVLTPPLPTLSLPSSTTPGELP